MPTLTDQEIQHLRDQLAHALKHLDAIIDAYDQPGVGQLSHAVKSARAWRKSKTAQDAPGAILSP